MNITNITFEKSFIIPKNQVYYVEELCKPYIASLSKVYITVAVFNICYSFVWLWLKNRKDKILFRIPIEDKTFVFTIGNVLTMLDTIFFMLNFFVIGYWLLIQNVEFVIKLPFVKWFT